MTTRRNAPLPTHCTECGTKLSSTNRSSSASNNSNVQSDYNDVCTKCYDYWGWENAHSDEAHGIEGNEDPACAVCQKLHPELRTGHTNTATRSHTSHANCAHPKTPKDRAACRKIRALG